MTEKLSSKIRFGKLCGLIVVLFIFFSYLTSTEPIKQENTFSHNFGNSSFFFIDYNYCDYEWYGIEIEWDVEGDVYFTSYYGFLQWQSNGLYDDMIQIPQHEETDFGLSCWHLLPGENVIVIILADGSGTIDFIHIYYIDVPGYAILSYDNARTDTIFYFIILGVTGVVAIILIFSMVKDLKGNFNKAVKINDLTISSPDSPPDEKKKFENYHQQIVEHEPEFIVYKILIEFADKFPRVLLLEIINKSDLDPTIVEPIVKNLISSGKIRAEFDDETKGIEFRFAVDEIDALMKVYSDWERGKDKKE